MRRQRGTETARKAAEMRMRRRQRTRGSGRHVPPRAAYRGQADPSVRPRRWRLPKPPWGSVGQLQEALQNTVEEILARDKKLVSDFWRGIAEPPRLQALRVCTSTNAQARAHRQRHADRQDHKQAYKQADILACFRAATRTYARRSSPNTPVRPHATCRLSAAAIVCGVSAGKYDAEAAKYWDLFYRRNEDRFFKVPTSRAASPAACSRPLLLRAQPRALGLAQQALAVGLRRLVGIRHLFAALLPLRAELSATTCACHGRSRDGRHRAIVELRVVRGAARVRHVGAVHRAARVEAGVCCLH